MSLVLLESLAPSSQNLPSAELGVSISRVAQKTVSSNIQKSVENNIKQFANVMQRATGVWPVGYGCAGLLQICVP